MEKRNVKKSGAKLGKRDSAGFREKILKLHLEDSTTLSKKSYVLLL